MNRRPLTSLSLAAPVLLLAACNETLPLLHAPLAPTHVRQANRHSGIPGSLPSMSPEQLQRMDAALSPDKHQGALAASIREAAPIIRDFTRTSACINSYSTSRLAAFAAPRSNYQFFSPPMLPMRYHDKSSCLSIVRYQGWSMPAQNALRMEVVYHADDSGEGATRGYELTRQPDGQWLFSRF